MKNVHRIFLLVICSVLAFGCSTPDEQKISVHGDIDNLGQSQLLVTYYKEKDVISSHSVYSNHSGKFDLKIDAYDEITPIRIYFVNKKCWTTLFARPGDNVNIKGNIDMVDMLIITGGTVNNDLNRFKKQIRRLYLARLAILNGKYANKEESAEHLAQINLILKRLAKEFIKDNPSSVASVVLIQDFFYQDYDTCTKDLLNLLKGDAKDYYLTKQIREGILRW